MKFKSEIQFETYIRELINRHISAEEKKIYALNSKKGVDILICNDYEPAKIYFLEVKYHIKSHGRLGFGGAAGGGFQPEMLTKRPEYFEENLRWVLSEEGLDKFYFLSNKQLLKYISGGKIGNKFNNIQAKIFKEENGLTELEFIDEMKKWFMQK